MGHFKRGKARRDRKYVIGRFGCEDRHDYRRLVNSGDLVNFLDYEDAWYGGVFDSRLGTLSQSMTIPYKSNHDWDWQGRDDRSKLKRKGATRKWFNAYAVRPRYKNVDRSTIRKDVADMGTFELIEGVYVDRSGLAIGDGMDWSTYDSTPTTGVCKGCDRVMTYKEARLYDYDICWECSREIDEEMMSVYLAEEGLVGDEWSGGLNRLMDSHRLIEERYDV